MTLTIRLRLKQVWKYVILWVGNRMQERVLRFQLEIFRMAILVTIVFTVQKLLSTFLKPLAFHNRKKYCQKLAYKGKKYTS